MTLILLNVILCSALLAAVLGLLIWAIVTSRRDQPPVSAWATRRPRQPQPRPRPGDAPGRRGARVRRPSRPSAPLSS